MAWGGLVGGALSGAGSYFGAKEQNRANVDIAKKDREFAERMSNTSYQRGMADLGAAGLNPILAYQRGGASSPTYTSPNAVNELGPAISSAQQAYNTYTMTENTREDTDLKESQKKLNKEQELKTFWDKETAQQNSHSAFAEAQMKEIQLERMRKYGDSLIGRTGFTFEKMGERSARRAADAVDEALPLQSRKKRQRKSETKWRSKLPPKGKNTR